jgi:membrane protein
MRSTRAERQDWLRRANRALAEHIAAARERVMARREAAPESGRKGGAVAAALARPAPVAPARRRETTARTGEGVEAAKREGAGGALEIAKRTFKEFGNDNGTLMAASLAFYLVLSLVPIALVAVSLLGYLLRLTHNPLQAEHQVLNFLNQFIPVERETLKGVITGVVSARKAIGGIGLIGLMLTAATGFETLETAINITWQAPKRGFVKSKLFALGMMFLIGFLLVLSIAVTGLAKWATGLPVLDQALGGWLLQALGWVLPVAISAAMFTCIFRLFPNIGRPKGWAGWKPALIAGAATAVLWEVFKIGYAFYSTNMAHQGATYGAMAGFIGLITWIYYSSALVLLGSELTWVLEGCPRQETKEGGPGTPGVGK